MAQTLEASDWPLNIALVADDRAHARGLLRVVMLALGVGALGDWPEREFELYFGR